MERGWKSCRQEFPSLFSCLSTTGLPGQAELAEQPTLPEQALPTVARLIEALEKQGMGSLSIYLQGGCGCTHADTHSAHIQRCLKSIVVPA